MLNKSLQYHHICISILILISRQIWCTEKYIEVNLKQGLLSGIVNKTLLKQQTYYAFKGIPYAQPPIGNLRFKPPLAHQGWDGVYEAHVNKPTCLQFNSRIRNGEPFGISGSEDCLHISIFTPSLEKSAPVIVFDYNDNFRAGFNDTDTYSPDFFIEEDLIVVTINHRVGVFGYLTTEDDVVPANAGIKDFIMGLKWIKDNVRLFGGDPKRITVMGSRGGAALVDILLHSDKSKGLFTSAIMQSGTALEPIFFYKTPSQKAFELGAILDIKTNDSTILLEGLQKINATKLAAEESNMIDDVLMEDYQLSVFPFAPTVESSHSDSVIKCLPEDGKIQNDVPVIIGMNSREGLDLVSHLLFEPRLLTEMPIDFFIHFPLRSAFRFDRKSGLFSNAVKEIKEFYFKEGYLYYGNILEYAIYVGDILQNYALDYAAKKLADDKKSPVFYYMFDFRGQLNENTEYLSKRTVQTMKHWGATIGDELCYLHLCSRIEKSYKELIKLVSEQAEIKVLKKMVRMWANFAKTGNPTATKDDDVLKGFNWSPIHKGSNETNYLHITKKLYMRVNPLGDRAKFWDDFLNKYSQLAIDGVVGHEEKTHDEL